MHDITQTPGQILIADDDIQSRRIHAKALKREGYEITEAADGQEAVDLFREIQPDLIIMDVVMPVMDGFEACRQIKQMPGGEYTPILMFSSHIALDEVKHAFDAGATDYLTKPLNMTILSYRARSLIAGKKAQDHLHNTRNLLHHVLTNAPLFFYVVDTDGIFTLAEGKAMQNIGLSAESIVGGSFFEHCQDQPWLLEGIQYALAGEAATRIVNVDNVSFQVWHAPLYDQRQRIIGAMGVGNYFVEQDWKDNALVESQRAIQTLMSNLPGMAYRSHRDPEFAMDFVSEGCYSLTGYHASDLIGNHKKSYVDLIHPEDRETINTTLDEAYESGEPFHLTYRIFTADGTQKWVWEQGRRVRSRSHAKGSLEGFITDISERKRIEEALATERNLLRTVIDNLPDYIFAKDTEGRFIASNAANAKYLGVEHPKDTINKRDIDFFPKDRADAFRADDIHVMEHRKPITNHEIPVYYPETDATRWYAVTKAPLMDSKDKVVGMVGLIREITRRKEAEEQILLANTQLAELNRLKSHFLLTISHELRTPLNSIIGYTDMLRQEMLGPINEKQQDRLERVYRNSKDLLHLIEDVLDISKIQTGNMEINLKHVPVEPFIMEIVPPFEEEAKAKDVMLLTDILPDLPPVYGDVDALKKVLLNLLSNAVKFTHSGYIVVGAQPIPRHIANKLPVRLSLEQDTWIMISVQDTGIGISTEVKQQLFDEFRQADSSATREHGGTGLGLALSHKLVELMHGQIWLESAPGFGTTFFVVMPTTDKVK